MENNLNEFMDGRPKTWLADQTGIKRTTLNNYFKGIPPRLDNAYIIADVFNKSVYDIWPHLKADDIHKS
ncbi:helix-turn-helix transcriptional regulator [Tuberibacillus sp. Marseille-P3662]|uniref:helix-turn-helix transcriptional regulator n=1 Tax=Tuberibacillus sp. Marseille-P3662 TaxID=1965358 RepID=UPI000A1CBAC0|nr:helix-turn-helix transcriptional regulator [Tuberibacillus sp. Marseille-P3662]